MIRKVMCVVFSVFVLGGPAAATGWPDPDDAYCSTQGAVKTCKLR